MAHRAQDIINKVKTLVTGLTTTGTNVYENRQYAIPNDVTRALTIAIGSDGLIGDDYTNNLDADREIIIFVQMHIKASEAGLNNLIFEIEAEIWRAIMADDQLSFPFVIQVIPGGRQSPEEDELSEKPAIKCNTVWRVQYRHSLTDPGQ